MRRASLLVPLAGPCLSERGDGSARRWDPLGAAPGSLDASTLLAVLALEAHLGSVLPLVSRFCSPSGEACWTRSTPALTFGSRRSCLPLPRVFVPGLTGRAGLWLPFCFTAVTCPVEGVRGILRVCARSSVSPREPGKTPTPARRVWCLRERLRRSCWAPGLGRSLQLDLLGRAWGNGRF